MNHPAPPPRGAVLDYRRDEPPQRESLLLLAAYGAAACGTVLGVFAVLEHLLSKVGL